MKKNNYERIEEIIAKLAGGKLEALAKTICVDTDELRQILFQREEEVREETLKEITSIVEKWMETSNPAHAQDLFDKLSNPNPHAQH